MPSSCRRQSWVVLAIILSPATAAVLLWAVDAQMAAMLAFLLSFVIVTIGTILPRNAWFGRQVSRVGEPGHHIWLTIDDGPDPLTTPALLDLLDSHQAKALFFVVGQKVLTHPELTREIARRGHHLGNHSLSHPSSQFWSLPPWRLWREVAGCQQALQQVLGHPATWFRPPVGHHNPFLANILRSLGLNMMIWNCRGFDGAWRDVDAILRHIVRNLRPGAIVLLHDSTPIASEVLDRVLQLMQERGLRPTLPLEKKETELPLPFSWHP